MSNTTAFNSVNHLSSDFNSRPLWNFIGAIPAALLITFGLLYIMLLLVHKEYPVIVPKPVPVIPNVIAQFPDHVPVIQEPLPVKPVAQTPPPAIRNLEIIELNPEPGLVINERVVTAKPPAPGVVSMGGQMIPFIKIAPQYPQNAAAKGIEGYVDVMFDVTALGTTENIRIIAYVPSSVFNKSVVKAIKGWKYKPNVVDGVPVKTYDVKDRVRFAMEK